MLETNIPRSAVELWGEHRGQILSVRLRGWDSNPGALVGRSLSGGVLSARLSHLSKERMATDCADPGCDLGAGLALSHPQRVYQCGGALGPALLHDCIWASTHTSTACTTTTATRAGWGR